MVHSLLQVVRNVGVPFGHTVIGFKSLKKGLGKIKVNAAQLSRDLDENWCVQLIFRV